MAARRKSPAAERAKPAGPTFALALGGGGARGLAHIHALEALDELGIKPVAISGSSIGAIMGAAYASGMSGEDIHEHSRAVLRSPAEVAARVWRSRPGSFTEMVGRGLGMSQFDLERILESFLPESLPKTFAGLKIPLKVTATDYFGHHLTIIEKGDLNSAIAASAALPAIFKPIHRGGRLLIDGGFYNPVPFDILEDLADIVIAIDVVGAPEPGLRKTPGRIDMMFGSSQLMMRSIIDSKLTQMQPDILLRPPVSRFRVLDFLKIDAVLKESVALKDDLKRAVEQTLAARTAA